MKLWKISTDDVSWDQYDAFIIAAEKESKIKGLCDFDSTQSCFEIEYIGEAEEGTEEGVILGSFNAG